MKMKITFGIFAHVDAGKTTFSEQILYHQNVIRKKGRVDHKDTFLDHHEIEKARGITIFSDQAFFSIEKDQYYFIDTPGHVDFSPEMERSIHILDYAVLLISGMDGVQGHTNTVWELLRNYHIPTFLFVNKMDRDEVLRDTIEEELLKELSDDIIFVYDDLYLSKEKLAQRDEVVLEKYLADQKINWDESVRRMIKEEKIFPCMFGSAQFDIGILKFLEFFHKMTVTNYENKRKEAFSARVYKIRQEDLGMGLTYLKVLSGELSVKDEITRTDRSGNCRKEKVNQIFLVNGNKKISVSNGMAGDLLAVSGPESMMPGDGLGTLKDKARYQINPPLIAKVVFDKTIPAKTMVDIFRRLEAEEPMLKCHWEVETEQLKVSTMGKLHLEILKEMVQKRFHYQVDFDKPEVLYMETIQAPVIGYGHFEPLRHYAEVVLQMEPVHRGSGIVCESNCSVDTLPVSYQNLILKHIMERDHKGILTGSPITDLKIILLNGIYHLKHTEGGDFREATYRAIRQGLEKAVNILLEPIYSFKIEAKTEYTGRILSDISSLHGTFQSPVINMDKVLICGMGPVATFFDYYNELISFTKGKGRITFQSAGYDVCHNQEEVIKKMNYQKDSDLEYSSSSVFCSKGTSFVIKWEEAEKYMHSMK